VAELAREQEKEDELTDSESDDEEAYRRPYVTGAGNSAGGSASSAHQRPSMASVRHMLRAPPAVVAPPVSPRTAAAVAKGGKPAAAAPAAAAAAPAPAAPGTNDSTAAESFKLSDSDRRADQVELMRDRKILDMEAVFRKRRYKRAEEVADR
jgi:hypothetical protein